MANGVDAMMNAVNAAGFRTSVDAGVSEAAAHKFGSRENTMIALGEHSHPDVRGFVNVRSRIAKVEVHSRRISPPSCPNCTQTVRR
jgi:hypothetical protein